MVSIESRTAASCGKRLEWPGLPDGLLAFVPGSDLARLLLGQNREDQFRKARLPGKGLRLVERQAEETWLLFDERGEIALDIRARNFNRVRGALVCVRGSRDREVAGRRCRRFGSDSEFVVAREFSLRPHGRSYMERIRVEGLGSVGRVHIVLVGDDG